VDYSSKGGGPTKAFAGWGCTGGDHNERDTNEIPMTRDANLTRLKNGWMIDPRWGTVVRGSEGLCNQGHERNKRG